MYSFTQQQAVESFVAAKIDQSTQKLREEIKNLIKAELQQTPQSGNVSQNSTKATTNQATSGQGFTSQVPQPPTLFNYLIEGPEEEDPKSAIAAEINLDSPNLYVLGLQDQELKWVTGGEGGIPQHPWQISRKIEDGIVYFKVNPNSVVFAGVGTFEEIAISGLDSWEEGVEGHVTLNGTVENNQLIDLEVVWGEAGGAEPRAEYDGQNRQTLLKTRLGFIYEDSSGRLRVRQEAFSNFTAIMSCYDSKPTICLIQT